MLETKTTIINGQAYSSTQFGARVGLQLQARVMAIVGPLLGGAAGAMLPMMGEGKKTSELEVSPELFVNAFASLAAVKPTEFANLAESLLANTSRNDKKLVGEVFNSVFSGNYQELYKAIGFALDTNFSSLFGESGISGLIAHLKVKASTAFAASSAPSSETKD